MRRRKTRTRRLELGAAALAALCLSGCGGDAKRAAPPPPTLPNALATSLAERSDAVANALAEGDSCRALSLAQQLQRDTITAVNSGRVDERLREDLMGAVNDLAGRVSCVPPPQPQEEDDDHSRGKHKGKGHGKNKHGDEG